MNNLIEVFRMNEISPEARCEIIIELGKAINWKYGANLTEKIVYELVSLLLPNYPKLKEMKEWLDKLSGGN